MPNQIFKTWGSLQIEKIHLQFCKRLQKVKNKASNFACKAELEYILACFAWLSPWIINKLV